MSRRALPLLVVLAALCGPVGAARAIPAPTAAGDIPLAEEFWGGPPSQCTSLTVGYAPVPGAAGDATQPAPGWSGPCEMQLTEVGAYSAEYVCLIVVHEEGHLHGFGHTGDPRSIMFGGAPLRVAQVPQCETPGGEYGLRLRRIAEHCRHMSQRPVAEERIGRCWANAREMRKIFG